MSLFNDNIKYAFGGFVEDDEIRFDSTSGGAFSAIVDAFCDENYVIFGAESNGLEVVHSYIEDKENLYKFRKSKYSQSKMNNSYKDVRNFLLQDKKVLFSGTPCQVAGIKMYLETTKTNMEKLLLVEVICEGVPSPLYMRKYEEYLEKKYGNKIESVDYRYTGKSILKNGKWDFQAMKIKLKNRNKEITIDRWYNPFWSIWLNHLMSRPSCYECKFARNQRVADISLGDLWGVHLYCPELYGKNGGASVVFANTNKGKDIVNLAENKMYGHELRIENALKYQSPMRKHIDRNEKREAFMKDLRGDMSYEEINKKWATKAGFKLLFQKYVWGNRQKIWLWNISKGKYKIK